MRVQWFRGTVEEQREAYLRWEPAKPDAGAFRGDKLDSLNAATLETIHEKASAENAAKQR